MTGAPRFALTFVAADAASVNLAAAAGIERIGAHDPDLLAQIAGPVEKIAWLDPDTRDDATPLITAFLVGGATTVFATPDQAGNLGDTPDRIAGRARIGLWLSRLAHLKSLGQILARADLGEIYIDLDRLSAESGLAPGKLLASSMVDAACAEIHQTNRPLSIGGIGRLDDPTARPPADLIYAQLARLGVSGACLASGFIRSGEDARALKRAVQQSRARLDHWASRPAPALAAAKMALERHLSGQPLR